MTSYKHFLQSEEWGAFKTKYGTTAVIAGGVQYTKHKIPFTQHFVGYAPKVDLNCIDFGKLKKSALEENCAYINLDCPMTIKGQEDLESLLVLNSNASKAKKSTFAQANVLLDLTPSEDELLANMHHKKRYNIKKAEKSGIKVVFDQSTNQNESNLALETFYKIHQETSIRQKFYIKPIKYYQTMYELLSKSGIAKIATAYLDKEPISSWMLFIYQNVLYYPYGGSTNMHQNLFPNELLCWESIKFGKSAGCNVFDMWGASVNPEDKTDEWYGFTNFKLGFGGKHVVYVDSFDLVANPTIYSAFNLVNDLRWKFLRLKKG